MREKISNVARRLDQSAVAWSWAFNALRLGAGLLLLPLIVRALTKADLGMYYVFMSLTALVPLVDFGFLPTIGRYVSYAMAGAEELKAHGMAEGGGVRPPNFPLLWQLLHTTRQLYRRLSLIALALLGVAGTLAVGWRVKETASLNITWTAWGLTLAGCIWEIYAGWWGAFLTGMNEVRRSARLLFIAQSVKVALAVVLLLCGGGLLALPAATLVGAALQRGLTRRACLRRLPAAPATDAHAISLLHILWPNSWRLGMQFLSGYLSSYFNTFICLGMFGLEANGIYGLSAQVFNIAMGVASVWTQVKWPLVGQLRAHGEFDALQRMLQPRWWLQIATFLLAAAACVFVLPHLLRWIGSDKQVLPEGWMLLLALNTFLAMQFTFWGTLISTENRMPYIWPAVATNLASVVLAVSFIRFGGMGVGALVAAPLITGSLSIYWHWPIEGARSIRATLLAFTFRKIKAG